MAFSLTYQTILDSNIRHVYSGTPAGVAYRHSKEYPNMDQLRQQRENKHLKDYVLRVSEYREDYKCLVPRAPAFRQLPETEVDEIVDRLHQPKPNHEQQEEQTNQDEGQRKVTKEEMDEITERLHNTVTKVTTIRVNQTREAKVSPETKVKA